MVDFSKYDVSFIKKNYVRATRDNIKVGDIVVGVDARTHWSNREQANYYGFVTEIMDRGIYLSLGTGLWSSWNSRFDKSGKLHYNSSRGELYICKLKGTKRVSQKDKSCSIKDYFGKGGNFE